MYCNNCGHEVKVGDKFCANCGMPVENNYLNNRVNYNTNKQNQDTTSIGLIILCFFFPVVGLILFICWHKEKPRASKAYGIASLVGFVLSFLLSMVSLL